MSGLVKGDGQSCAHSARGATGNEDGELIGRRHDDLGILMADFG
jgi:hypothetical protein